MSRHASPILFVCVALFSANAASPAVSAAPGRLVLAYYYPLYDQNTWKDPLVPDHPAERYVSSDSRVMARHIEQAKGAQIDAFISAWYGPQTESNQTETNLRALLTLAQQRGFSIAAGVETRSPFFRTAEDVKNALAYLLSAHAAKPSYLKWNGKPVIFISQNYLPSAEGQSALAAWRAIRNQVDPGRRSLWIIEGFDMALLDVFDGDFLYSVAWSNDVGATARQWASRARARGGFWVGTVMPGWDDTRLVERPKPYKRDRQNGEWYRAAWAGAASANPDWIVITSWNEFVENTYIEPSARYGAQYLELTRALAANWKAGAPLNNPAPANRAASPPRATATLAPKPAVAVTDRRVLVCSEGEHSFCLVR